MNNSVEFSKWLAEEQIDVTSPNLDVEDFDAFLEKAKAKSAKKNAHSKLSVGKFIWILCLDYHNTSKKNFCRKVVHFF